MTETKVQFVKRSGNAKTGPIPVTVSERASCPDTCKLKSEGGCYYEATFYTRKNWDKIDAGERGGNWADLVAQVKRLPAAQLWRHNVGGDLPHRGGLIDVVALGELTDANHGKRGFTYTHHAVATNGADVATTLWNRAAIKDANRAGLAVNLSADNLHEADQLADLDIGPVVAVVPADQLTNTVTPAGRKVVICPAVTTDSTSCGDCALCHRQGNRPIVGFPAHGSRRSAAASH